jgi:GT2 family glycosyltransferase
MTIRDEDKNRDVSIVIPLFNQLEYTRRCLESLLVDTTWVKEIILINNGSSDGTAEYLATLKGITVITNPENMGCAAAWNQGVKAASTHWIAILNNDIIASPDWLHGLLESAVRESLDIVSPAFREGDYNYDIAIYSREFTDCMGKVSRTGIAQGVCFMVKRRVFEAVGFFDENFRIGQFEDADFFRRAKDAGFRLGTTGRSFIHHFGSVTQNSIRRSRDARPYEAENRAYFRRKWRLTWWKRFLQRRSTKLQIFFWRTKEKVLYGHSLIEKWIGGRLRYY